LIYSVAIKSGLTETEAEEVVQETVICVAKSIQKFKRDRARGSFKGWLRNLTRWRIADQLRKRTVAVAGGNTDARAGHEDELGGANGVADWEREGICTTGWTGVRVTRNIITVPNYSFVRGETMAVSHHHHPRGERGGVYLAGIASAGGSKRRSVGSKRNGNEGRAVSRDQAIQNDNGPARIRHPERRSDG